MKKFALALLVLALTVPASAAVNLTMAAGTGADSNKITVSYACTAGEEVRAFALNIAVTNGKFSVGSAAAISNDYYIYPGSIQFAVAGTGETYISNLGTPVAEQTVNGGVIEMASLYAAGDVNHPNPPPSSGALLSFRVNCGAAQETVTLSLNTKRGGVVLKDPNVTPTTNLPQSINVCAIPQNMCWLCPGQDKGDTNGDGTVNTQDLLALKKSWLKTKADPHGTGTGQYNCCADFNRDDSVNTQDLLKLKQNWLKSGLGTCLDLSCL